MAPALPFGSLTPLPMPTPSPAPGADAAGTDAPLDGLTFETLLTRLDALSATLDDPDLGLDDAVARYEAAAEIARHALDRLQRAEARVQHLSLQ